MVIKPSFFQPSDKFAQRHQEGRCWHLQRQGKFREIFSLEGLFQSQGVPQDADSARIIAKTQRNAY